MKKIPLALILLLIILVSCKKEDEIEDKNQKSFFLNTKIVDGKVEGFRFENNIIIEYPNLEEIKPDFMVLAQTNDTGLVIGPFLSNPDMKNVFILTKEFTELDSAKLFYNSYNYSDDTIFEIMALNVRPYQIWTIKSENDIRGKLLILKTKGEEIENNTPYAEMEFLADKLSPATSSK